MAFALSAAGRWALHEPENRRFIIAAAIGLLRDTRDQNLVNRGLKHLHISVDDNPRSDAIHLRALHQGRPLSLREASERLHGTQLSTQVDRIETAQTGLFEYDPAEAFARVVSIYRIDWSNFMPYAPAVKAGFMRDPRATQEEFLTRFLELYDEGTDVTGLAGAPAAAQWLKSVRVCTAQHTLVLRAAPINASGIAALELSLHEALHAFDELVAPLHRTLAAPLVVHRGHPIEQLYSEVSFLKSTLQELARPDPAANTSAAGGLSEVLEQLQVPQPRRDLHQLITGCRYLLTCQTLPYQPTAPELVAAFPALEQAWARLRQATDAAWEHAW